MRRVPLPLVFAGLIAFGATVAIIIKVVIYPLGGVIWLSKDMATSIQYSAPSGLVAVPVGHGRFVLTPNTTNWYYGLVGLTIPRVLGTARPFTGVLVMNITLYGKAYTHYVCNMSNRGAIAISFYGLRAIVGDWVRSGGYYVLKPRNYTVDLYGECARQIMAAANTTYLYVYEPRADYFKPTSSTDLSIYYDSLNATGHVTATYYTGFSLAWQSVSTSGTTAGFSLTTFDNDNWVIYPPLVIAFYNGTSPTTLTAKVTN